eukprot:CAMPEP_0195516874 /NCGR_PEP_ID=MMETSP0794_2-20130614/8879_1 /TAXON_ID=515487 /ORGANISM="Stephanopyxis turris, Strain CCMP 815" /LENGTH=457 /DNA_ID=CAMNT_0040645581 /DNA_START=80 /DNA_END=1454 /DNA_ORIENTATION=+
MAKQQEATQPEQDQQPPVVEIVSPTTEATKTTIRSGETSSICRSTIGNNNAAPLQNKKKIKLVRRNQMQSNSNKQPSKRRKIAKFKTSGSNFGPSIARRNVDANSHQTKNEQQQEDDETEISTTIEEMMNDDLPCDTLLAFRSLVQRNACGLIFSPSTYNNVNVPFVTRPMIHSIMAGSDEQDVGASTGVSMELDELQQSNKIRLLKLMNTGCREGGVEDDVAVVETELYENEARGVILSFLDTSGDHSTDTELLLDGFLNTLGRITRMSVREDELMDLLNNAKHSVNRNNMEANKEDGFKRESSLEHEAFYGLRGKGSKQRSSTEKEEEEEEESSRVVHFDARTAISKFVKMGLLLPRKQSHQHLCSAASSSSANSAYWFSLPGMGEAAKHVTNGRNEMLTKLKCARYKEISRNALEQKLLRTSKLSPEFHVRDLISIGKVDVKETAAGMFVKLPP